MRTKYYISYIMALMAVWLFAGACSDDDQFEAGPAVSENCQQVYFKEAATRVMLDLDLNERSTTVTVARMKADAALTLPISVVSKSAELTIPESVSFEAGEYEAELVVSIADGVSVEKGSSYSYEIQLVGEHVDPYSELPGSSIWKGTLAFPQILRAKCYFESTFNKLGNIEQEILDLGEGNYLIENFLGSDYSFELSVGEQGVDCTPNSQIVLGRSSGGYQADDSYGYYWNFVDDYDNWIWHNFYPKEGTDIYITGLYFYFDYTAPRYDYGASEPWVNSYWDSVEQEFGFWVYVSYSTDGPVSLWPVNSDIFYMQIVDKNAEIDWSVPEPTDDPDDGDDEGNGDDEVEEPGTGLVAGTTIDFSCYFLWDSWNNLNMGTFTQRGEVIDEKTIKINDFMNSGHYLTITLGEWSSANEGYAISALESDGGYQEDPYFYFYVWTSEEEGYNVDFYPNNTENYINCYFDLTLGDTCWWPTYNEADISLSMLMLNGTYTQYTDILVLTWE